jgi:transcriptional regulator with XRE-family HTH domain
MTRWERLAELLRHQRVVVLGCRSRAQFARDLGLTSDRVLNDLENASRDNYDPDTLLALEGWYRLPIPVLAHVLGDRWPQHYMVEDQETSEIKDLRESIEQMQALVETLQAKLTQAEERRAVSP